MQKQLMTHIYVKKYLFFALFFLVIFCACGLEKAKKTKFSPEAFGACTLVDVAKRISLTKFCIGDEVVHYIKSDLAILFGWTFRNCNCKFPKVYDHSTLDPFASPYYFIQLYWDSQQVYKGHFLRHCENTEGMNQAFINANIKTGDYSHKELAEIIKRWGETGHSVARPFLDSILQNPRDTLISNNKPCGWWVQMHFISNYDTAFPKIRQKILNLDCTECIYSRAEANDSLVNDIICQEWKKNIQVSDTNTVLILDYVCQSSNYSRLTACVDTIKDGKWENIYCLPDFIYQFDIYDKDGFVQVKKKILNGYNLFLR